MLTTAERIEQATAYGVGTKAYVDTFGGMAPVWSRKFTSRMRMALSSATTN